MNFSIDDVITLCKSADIVTVDTEGMGIMMGFSLCFNGMAEGVYLPFNHDSENLSVSQQAQIYEVLSTRKALVFHNAIHDLRVLSRAGFNYTGKFYDTMLMAHWLHEERLNYSLDNISQIYGGKPKNMPDIMKFIIETEGWNKVPVGLMTKYSGNDAFITHELFNKLYPKFVQEKFDGELWATEQVFIREVMGPMMDLGVRVDLAFCIREYMKGIAIMDECKSELAFNPGSTKDLKAFLIDELKLPIIKVTPGGKPSFNKETMLEYDIMLASKQDKRAQTILRYRGWQKTTSSNYKPYLDLCDDQGVLHPSYKLHGTRTHRLSCEKPALQQIPKSSDKEWNGGLKQAFIPREGCSLWSVDYSQLQFRMTCAYANQEDLLDIFNLSDRDVFTEMAEDMGWKRQDVKTLVYLILFAGGAKRAADAFNVSVEQGAELVSEFHTKYPRIRKVSNECSRVAQTLKYVRYWTGQRRHFIPFFVEGMKVPPKYYRAFNAVIQGGEAEIMKRSMLRLQAEVCNADCKMVLQIHDEIVFEITNGQESDYLPRIKTVMELVPDEFCKAIGTYVKFTVDYGRWGKK